MWPRNSRYLGIIFVFTLFLFNLTLINAKDISINYPLEVSFEEEFEFKIELIDFENVNYDVKVDINEESRIARIWSEEKWQSTSYYVKNASIEGEIVLLKIKIIEDVDGEFPIVIKIRENGKSASENFDGFFIKVIKKIGDNDESNLVEDVGEEDDENNVREVVSEIQEINEESEEYIEKKSGVEKEEVIYLSPPVTKNINSAENDKVLFKSTNEKIKYYSIYAFAIFCVILIILLLVDKSR